MLEPTERLGAGEPGTPYDMEALRKHPFFDSINWDTLWSDPAPPMEAGLVRKVHPSEHGIDAGFAWDQLVGSSDSNDGNSPWEDESITGDDLMASRYPFAGAGDEVGPLDIVSPPERLAQHVAMIDETELRGRAALPIPVSTASKAQHPDPINISPPGGTIRGSIISTGSTTSSSEGSPVGRLNSSMDAMTLAAEQGRGRDRAQTPIQLTTEPDAKWAAFLLPGEKLVFHGPVELKSRTRRLTATLIPIPATQNRPKIRHLMLTTQRLVCAKVKHGRKISLKNEALLRPGVGIGCGAPGFAQGVGTEREKKERESKPVITSVLAKGQKTFIVMTVRCTSITLSASFVDKPCRSCRPASHSSMPLRLK